MKNMEDWEILLKVKSLLEGDLFFDYLQNRGIHTIFYSQGRRNDGGIIFVLKEEWKEAKDLLKHIPLFQKQKEIR